MKIKCVSREICKIMYGFMIEIINVDTLPTVSRETFRQVLQVPDFNIVIWFLLKTDIVIKFGNVWA